MTKNCSTCTDRDCALRAALSEAGRQEPCNYGWKGTTESKEKTKMKSALIVVDNQNDFRLGGSLEVPGANAIDTPIFVDLIDLNFAEVIFTREEHPTNHSSFKENGGPWPPHCIADTIGAAFGRIPPKWVDVAVKGTEVDKHPYSSYSSVIDPYEGIPGQPLHQDLSDNDVDAVFICGLAHDYCVSATAIDFAKGGFKTYIILDACRGIAAGSMTRATIEMYEAGVLFTYAANVAKELEGK